MVKLVRGRDGAWDGIEREPAGQAPHWRPDRQGLLASARELRAEARALSAAALGGQPELAGRALTVRAEAAVAAVVANYTAPSIDPGGLMPYGPASGPLDHATMDQPLYDHRADRYTVAKQPVRMRRGPAALAGLPPSLCAAAARYLALVEAVSSPGGAATDGPGSLGISDGGATSRCALAEQLKRRALPAIGAGYVLRPRGPAAHADRPRHVLTVVMLVNQVCLSGLTIDRVLAASGWSRRHAYRKACRDALTAALSRLAQAI
jgi:hypothetical protein